MSNQISVQTLLECIREFDEAGENESKEKEISSKHKRLGVQEVLQKQALKYQQFWDTLGEIKTFEAYYWIDQDSREEEEEEGEFPPNAFPFTNKQTLEYKALIAWHLFNILDKKQDPIFTREQARYVIDRAINNEGDL